MITAHTLKQARRQIRKQANYDFPDLIAVDKPGPNVEAALKVVDIDVDDAVEFVNELLYKNKTRLNQAGIVSIEQTTLMGTAMLHMLALGVKAAESDA